MSRRQLVVLLPLILGGCQLFQTPEPVQPEVAAEFVCPAPPEPQACPEPTVIEVEKECPVPLAAEPVATTAPAVQETPPANQSRAGAKQLLIIGSAEWITIAPPNVRLRARINTGIEVSSLAATDIIPFEREGKRWVRFSLSPSERAEPIVLERPVRTRTKAKQNGNDQGLVVAMLLQLADIEEEIDVLLHNQESEFPLLVGRNFLTDNAVVDVSKTFTIRD